MCVCVCGAALDWTLARGRCVRARAADACRIRPWQFEPRRDHSPPPRPSPEPERRPEGDVDADSEAPDDSVSPLDEKAWLTESIALANANEVDLVVECTKLSEKLGTDEWRSLSSKRQCKLFAIMLRGLLGEGERVPLILEHQKSTRSWTWHASSSELDELVSALGMDLHALQGDDAALNAVLRRLLCKKLKPLKSIRPFENEYGETVYRTSLAAVKVTEQTAYLILCCLFSGILDLNSKDVHLMSFKLLVKALGSAPFGPTTVLHIDGASTLAVAGQEVRVLGESTTGVWDLMLRIFGMCCNWVPEQVQNVLCDPSFTKNWRDVIELNKHMSRGVAQFRRWRSIEFRVRELGREFLADMKGKIKAPLRSLLFATADWLTRILVTEYKRTAKASRLKKERNFALFSTDDVDTYERVLKNWRRSWIPLEAGHVKTYRNMLSEKKRAVEVKKNAADKLEFASVRSERTGMSCTAGTPLYVKVQNRPCWASYVDEVMPSMLNCRRKRWSKCNACKQPACWPCKIVGLTVALSNACLHAKALGTPFANSVNSSVSGDVFGLNLPTEIVGDIL